MRNRFLLFAVICIGLWCVASCKKFIEQQQQNAIVDLVTKGDWRVTRYINDENRDLTDSLSNYIFHFNKDGTVYGVQFGQQTNGTWSADVGTKSITSAFPAAPYPVTLLNYTWIVTDSYTDSVAAKTMVGAGVNVLSLKKTN